MALRDDIRDIDDCKIQGPIEVPEWETSLYVRTMTGPVYGRLMVNWETLDKAGKAMAALVCASACNERGERVFADDDLEWLQDKNANALQRVFLPAFEINKLGKVAVEELRANFPETPSADSGLP